MIENRRGLTIFSHTMLILGIIVILFPLYVAFTAATLDDKAVFETPMTLIPGGHLFENMKTIWVNGVGANSAPFWLMMLNSFIMAFAITVGKITVSMLSAIRAGLGCGPYRRKRRRAPTAHSPSPSGSARALRTFGPRRPAPYRCEPIGLERADARDPATRPRPE